MIILRLLSLIISTLLFAAHVMRFNEPSWAMAVLGLLLTLFIPRPWIIRFWQIILALATLKWVMITIELIQMRFAFEMPYFRLAIILIAVIIFNLLTFYITGYMVNDIRHMVFDCFLVFSL